MTTGPQRSFPPTTSSGSSASSSRPARQPRSRARTAVPLGVAAWLVLEIWLLTLVADAAGGLTVLLLLVAGVLLGAAVVKRAGRRAFRSLDAAMRGRQDGQGPGGGDAPDSEGNGLTMLGGILLIVPGLITDVAGLLLLVPPVQRKVRAALERSLERRLARATTGMEGLFQQARIHRPDGKVVQGEVIREEAVRDEHGPGAQDQRPPLIP
ncbi:FxsA family membrane protein [Streptomyces abyssomicinicus]|uniref:FxsA family membrane protein n=1 Tax=Streptomyces abyssomicinicus TaxID=574929 RepID=UPI001250A1FF|nr:FxsA family membrane protein [Streptomyces abyssomicinicus]